MYIWTLRSEFRSKITLPLVLQRLGFFISMTTYLTSPQITGSNHHLLPNLRL